MTERYFCESSLDNDSITLRGGEAHHLASVMRASVGDCVILFDGSGVECEASILRLTKREAELRIVDRNEVDREASTHLTLAVALPKGDRQKWLIEKAVELGVAKVVPLLTERSVAKLKESGLERLRRAVVEASKQCGRNRLMTIETPIEFSRFLQAGSPAAVRLIAHPSAAQAKSFSACAKEHRDANSWIAAIGPEGGFSAEEVQRANDAGWKAASLGPRILRVETAALKIAALLLGD